MDPIPQQHDPVAPQDEPLHDYLPPAYLAIREIESGNWDRYLSRLMIAIGKRVTVESVTLTDADGVVASVLLQTHNADAPGDLSP